MGRIGKKGFSLLEIMVAVAILAISMLVILDLHGNTMITSRRAEDMTVATMLGRMKMHELQLELETDISKGEFPADNKTLEGGFEEPFDNYRWTGHINQVEIPVPPAPSGEEGDNEDASANVMHTIFKLISEQIKESAREIRLEIKWDELGEEQVYSLTTHIVRL